MMIQFDDDTAELLISASADAAEVLSRQVEWRRRSAERAMEEFSGAYATAFERACAAEAADRSRLVGVLEDLGPQVETVKRQAAEEKQRRTDLAAWQEREAVREQQRDAGDALQPLWDAGATIFDPKPSEYAVIPAAISAAFTAQHRVKGGGMPGGRSSADPERLQTFAGQIRAADSGVEHYLVQLKSAWSRFTSACSWAPIDSGTFIPGFEMYSDENRADADWLERVAQAFEQAGGGSLSNTALNVVTIALSTAATAPAPKELQNLLKPGSSPSDIAAAWVALLASGFEETEITALPLPMQLRLANLDGLPGSARDRASRAVLDAALSSPETVYQAMGFQSAGGMSLDEFTSQVTAFRASLADADTAVKSLRGASGRTAQLLGFGMHEGALTSAISLGDVDTASNVALNVPGINSTLGSMGDKIRAANDLLHSSYDKNSSDSFAVVTWLGYRAPVGGEVWDPGPARSGGVRLANFIDGIYAGRGDAPRPRFTVAAHSYGSSTAAEALTRIRQHVSTFIVYGSPGISDDITRSDLKAAKVYATEYENDSTASFWGRGVPDAFLNPHLIDPRDIDGIQTFSSEADPAAGTDGVNSHAMHPDEAGEVGYLSKNSTSFNRIASLIAKGKLR